MKIISQSSSGTVLALALTAGAMLPSVQADAADLTWIATWSASPQPVWGTDFMFPANVPATLRDQTVRQTARVSLGGPRVRIALSNAYGQQPITVGNATIALPAADGTLIADSLHAATFGGQKTATILPGASLVSDPVALSVPALGQVVVSLYLPEETPVTTFHWEGRQTAWIVSGDQTAAVKPNVSGAQTISTTARPLLSGVLVEAPQATRTVAIIGDSITDGATASLDKDRRWPDFLAARLAPYGVGVINAGISGGRLLSDGMGVNALARIDRDVLSQPGVRSVVVMLGINDIAWPGTAFEPTRARPTLAALVAGYRQLIEQAHSRRIRVIGATLTPFEGALPGTPLDNYYQPDKDALRQQVNAWIRHGGAFDAVVDFDAALRDPAHPTRIGALFDSGDHLHPGDEGNRAMAETVDLEALLPGISADGQVRWQPSRAARGLAR
ncbi:MAG: SGNH/GDSL hydrolase family protein [Pandoraea sp.]|nr:SGNH/GDSL hydrolase family protein [Pandoraea sp.]MDR3400823.1 SGNH/GDSL hydrolase family protein [Pandoraea sp.]